MKYEMSMVRGDTLAFEIRIEGDVGTVTGIAMSCKKAYAEGYVFHKDLMDGVTPISGEDSAWRVRVAPADTEDATPGCYEYDVELSVLDEDTEETDVYTLLHGTLMIERDVTR